MAICQEWGLKRTDGAHRTCRKVAPNRALFCRRKDNRIIARSQIIEAPDYFLFYFSLRMMLSRSELGDGTRRRFKSLGYSPNTGGECGVLRYRVGAKWTSSLVAFPLV